MGDCLSQGNASIDDKIVYDNNTPTTVNDDVNIEEYPDFQAVSDDTKHLLDGYIRQIKKSMENNTNVVFDDIMSIILSFYHITEHFASTQCLLTENDTKVTWKDGKYSFAPAYGNIHIHSINDNGLCHIWKFKIGSLYEKPKPGEDREDFDFMEYHKIGIAKFDSPDMDYAYCLDGTKYRGNEFESDFNFAANAVKGDVVGMKLNMNEQTLSFDVNGKLRMIIDNIDIGQDIKYRMAVSLDKEGDNIQLLAYYTKEC